MNYNTIATEVLKKNCLRFFNNDELAVQVWMSKYALKNARGEYLESSPEERYLAIAQELARIDKNYHEHGLYEEDYYKYLVDRVITPAGSGLSGIGNPFSITSLSNCFVVSFNNEDSYGAIMRIDQEIVQIAKRRGGIGFDVSALRPSYTPVTNAAGTSTGAVSFIPRYSNSLREVAQDGRRGAGMVSMSVNYPDIEKFINLKSDKTTATGANLSVRVTDEFMNAVECNGTHVLRYPVTASRNESRDEGKVTRKNIPAKDLWNKMMKAAWAHAEPGILFWDKVLSESPSDCYPEFKTESVNPCAELPLSPYDSCRLLSVNLTPFVVHPFEDNAYFDFVEYKKAVRAATIMMDNIIDLELEKIDLIISKILMDKESKETKATELKLWQNIKKSCTNGRRAGISVIGHGDMLAMLNMPYATDESNKFCQEIQKKCAIWCYMTSIELASQRGPFLAYNAELEKDNPFINRLFKNNPDSLEIMRRTGRRNISMLTIPPSGSLSILLNNQTSGIEPAFALFYERKRKVTEDDPNKSFQDETGDWFIKYNVIHPGFKQWVYKQPWYKGITLETLPVEALTEMAKASPYAGSTSVEIDPIKKVEMQGMMQQYVDHSISVTHNLPEKATEADVSAIYFAAWKAGCKGCTVYREGSRDGILTTETEKPKPTFEYKDSPKRPRDLPCDIFYPTISGEHYIVLVGIWDGKPYEVFALKNGIHTLNSDITKGYLHKKKSKHYNLLDEDKNLLVDDLKTHFGLPEWNAVTRLLSWGLRHGGDITFAVEQLNESEGVVTDVSKVLARTLKKYVKPARKPGEICPQCGEEMRMQGGCPTCYGCGFSKCA